MDRYAPAVEAHPDGALIRVRVVPRASSTKLAGLHADHVKLRVSAPPADGRANIEALAHLAAALGVRARELSLVAGEHSRSKSVLVRGLDADEVARRLGQARDGG